MSTIAQAIKTLVGYVPGLALSDVDALAGLSNGHTSQITRGRTKSPADDTVRALAEAFGVEPAWLRFQNGRAPGARRVRAHVEPRLAKLRRAS